MWTTKLISAVARAEEHGWRIESQGKRGVYMTRYGKDRRVYVAYLVA